jgi:beta-glucanase (GH16 family)
MHCGNHCRWLIGSGCLASVPLLIAAQATPPPVPPTPPAGYTLIWADEFDVDGAPDAKNWTFENGFVRNEELQWYQPQNARVENGLLVIEARRERKANPMYERGSTDWRRSREFAEYTSASLMTRGLHTWQYGHFEMRGRIDTRAGLWPAWWTLGASGRWPHNGEIDIMEYYRGTLLANVAWGGPAGARPIWDIIRKPLDSLGNAEWSGRFHVWRMLWDERSIRLSVDDVWMNDVDLDQTVNQDGSGVNPLRQPHYMLVNVAIGGASGGNPSATAFPSRLEVDYIRVHQKAR